MNSGRASLVVHYYRTDVKTVFGVEVVPLFILFGIIKCHRINLLNFIDCLL